MYPAYNVCEFLEQNSDPTERGNMVENLPTCYRSFQKPTENIDATGFVTEWFESIEITTLKCEKNKERKKSKKS